MFSIYISMQWSIWLQDNQKMQDTFGLSYEKTTKNGKLVFDDQQYWHRWQTIGDKNWIYWLTKHLWFSVQWF